MSGFSACVCGGLDIILVGVTLIESVKDPVIEWNWISGRTRNRPRSEDSPLEVDINVVIE